MYEVRRCFAIINTIQVIFYNIQSGVKKSIAFVFSKYLNLQIRPHILLLKIGKKKRQHKQALTHCLSHAVCKWTVVEPW